LTVKTGRPDVMEIIKERQGRMEGRGDLGVAVCGPVGLIAETSRVVAHLEGKGAGISLHAEGFGW